MITDSGRLQRADGNGPRHALPGPGPGLPRRGLPHRLMPWLPARRAWRSDCKRKRSKSCIWPVGPAARKMPLPPSMLPNRAAAIGSCWTAITSTHSTRPRSSNGGLKLLAIDDFGALDHYAADIIVNQDPIADERLYVHRDPNTRLLLGTDIHVSPPRVPGAPRPQRDVPRWRGGCS